MLDQVSRQNTANGSSASKHISMLTFDDSASKSTMIVPVYVSHVDSPNREVLTYAMLDTQSDTCFVAESICT